jgi:hypothetical protein
MSTQELATQGYTVVPGNISPRLRKHLLRYAESPHDLLGLTRQAFDGLPMRMTEALIGESVLSAFGVGVDTGWHRGRGDTVESSAPGEFIPGFDFATVPGPEPCSLELIPGSGRLRPDDAIPVQTLRRVNLEPGDQIILDSRLLRRWPDKRTGDVFWLSTIRPWLTPAMDFLGLLEPNAPPRALRFFGVPGAPSRDVGAWLVRSHRKRETA